MISVIVPVYNVEPYLPQCLDSIVKQTYRDLEIILIDDGSTDGCPQICEEYAGRDKRIRTVHTENRGLASARNLGLELAKGSFLAWVDGDDWIEPDTIQILFNTAEQYHADIVVFGRCKEYIGETRYPQKKQTEIQFFHGRDILPAYAAGSFGVAVWKKLYCADCFRGIRFPDGHNYEDVAVTWKLMKNLSETGGSVVVLPQILYHFRMRKSSITHTKSLANIVDYWTAQHDQYENLPDYRDRILPSCFVGIGRMWANYASFTEQEKQKAAGVIREMQTLSRAHFREIIRGNDSLRTKRICVLSQFKNPLHMRLCGLGRKLLAKRKKTDKGMFD